MAPAEHWAAFTFRFDMFAISKQRLTLAGQEIASPLVPKRPFSAPEVFQDILNIYKWWTVNGRRSPQRTSPAAFHHRRRHFHRNSPGALNGLFVRSSLTKFPQCNRKVYCLFAVGQIGWNEKTHQNVSRHNFVRVSLLANKSKKSEVGQKLPMSP